MSTLAFDDGLADSFTSEPAGSDHVEELFDLTAAQLTAAFGFNTDTAEDVRARLEQPEGGRSAQLVIRDRARGAVVQWWGAIQEPGGELWLIWIRTQPGLPETVGDTLCRTGYAQLFDLIRSQAPAGHATTRVHSGLARGDEAVGRRLRAAGFTYERTFWEMTGPVAEAPQPAAPVAGLSIGATRDTATVHRVLDAAFEGAWAYETLTHDNWPAVEGAMAGHDPDLWVLAELDGTAVAAMILSRRGAVDGALYVQELATAALYRRRGIAAAMLRHAFDVAGPEGYDELSLHVDSVNEHDAPSVYRRAGLEVRCAFNVYACDLVARLPGDR